MTTLNISIQSQIKATVQSDKEFSVSFDDAWQWLDYSTKASAKRTLLTNFEENLDYLVFNNSVENLSGGRPTEEIYLTADCLKNFAMMANTSMGKEVRKYFLECERELKAIKLAPKEPTDILYLLEQSAAAIREARALAAIAESKVAELKPKADIYDVVVASDKLLSMSDAAKIINSPGLGRNNLMNLLRDKGVLQMSNLPYQKYVSQGQFEVVEVDTHAGLKTTCKVTQKGLSFLIRLLKDNGYTVPSKAA
ncbi:phage antirepressor KilAC domain-containing protein [Nostoc sp. UHCC 0251]|uniref:phage antirepressor KilAC domain-containing protein n=1 Tax=Nostoc sp. UHCC 0251 TaxID=3110240 RepID=UPI002B21166C|nr:phage antirepressor KilAC domain-containing protein [Nostoc sp. UHCC 0251]MEA5625299.1 phage antirepressor KilAC domain-containing protein [Nostoc sp. UHCC 0251]